MGIVTAMLTAALVVQTTEPAVLAPRGPWTVNFADNLCIASRWFGPNEKGVELALIPRDVSGDRMEILFRHAVVARTPMGRRKGHLSIDDRKVDASFFAEPFGEGAEVLTRNGLSLEDSQALMAASTVEIPVGIGLARLTLRDLPAVQRQLKICQRDLMAGLGVDLSALDTVIERPKVKRQANWQMNGILKYLKPGQGVSMHYLLTIASDGRIERCQLVNAQGRVDLTPSICPQLQREMRYQPGRDATGQAVQSWDLYPMRVTVE